MNRDPIPDIVDDILEITLSVGFIQEIDGAHFEAKTGEFNKLPASLTLDLPDESQYLSIEWSGATISSIVIDGVDQSEAFEITGNRAVSREKLVNQPDDMTVRVGVA